MEVCVRNLSTQVWIQAGGVGIEARLEPEARKVTEGSMTEKTRQKSPSPPASGQQRLQEAELF